MKCPHTVELIAKAGGEDDLRALVKSYPGPVAHTDIDRKIDMFLSRADGSTLKQAGARFGVRGERVRSAAAEIFRLVKLRLDAPRRIA